MDEQLQSKEKAEEDLMEILSQEIEEAMQNDDEMTEKGHHIEISNQELMMLVDDEKEKAISVSGAGLIKRYFDPHPHALLISYNFFLFLINFSILKKSVFIPAQVVFTRLLGTMKLVMKSLI